MNYQSSPRHSKRPLTTQMNKNPSQHSFFPTSNQYRNNLNHLYSSSNFLKGPISYLTRQPREEINETYFTQGPSNHKYDYAQPHRTSGVNPSFGGSPQINYPQERKQVQSSLSSRGYSNISEILTQDRGNQRGILFQDPHDKKDSAYKPRSHEDKASDDFSQHFDKLGVNTPDTEDYKYDQYIQSIKKSKGSRFFEDKDFPANDDSLYGGNEERRKKWGKCIWLRPYQIFGSNNFSLFQNGIEPEDVLQYKLGDCYILSPMSGLANSEARVKKLFITQDTSDDGKYIVQLYHMGELHKIVVDDLLPCNATTRKPLTRTHGNELWVLILEKAFAKLAGSYDAIIGGSAATALYALTGAPAITFYFGEVKKDKIWNSIKVALEKNQLVACGSKNFSKRVNEDGIVRLHAYEILDYDEGQNLSERLVKLRNPWGHQEWKGPRADKLDDGFFWMSFEDFTENFRRVAVCYCDDTYHHTTIKAKSFRLDIKSFMVNIKNPGEYFFTVHRRSRAPVCILVEPETEDDQRWFVKDATDKYGQVTLRGNFEAGKYVISVQVKWFSHKAKDFVFTSYGPSKTKITSIELIQEYYSEVD